MKYHRPVRFSFRFFHTLQFRLIAFGMALVVIGFGLRVILVLPVVQDQVREVAAAQQLAIANYVAHDVDENIILRLASLGRLAADLPHALLSRPAALQDWLRERQRLLALFSGGLTVVRADGSGLLAEYPVLAGRGDLDFSGSDWFRAALRGDRPPMGKPFRGRAGGEPLIVMSVPIRDASGHTLAVLAGVSFLNAPEFLERLQETRIGAHGGFLLVSPVDRLFVAASDPGMVFAATPPPGVNALHDRAMAGFRGTGVTLNARGVEELVAMVTVPSTGWFVVARLPTEEAFRPLEVLRTYVMRNSLTVLAVLLVVFLVALPRFFRPLTETARAMRRMADGEVELHALPVTRRDEVGDLIAGFNALVEALQKKEAALQTSQERLAFMAHHDPLTRLPNRSLLEDRLEQALARAEREKGQLALLFCDLDGFKPINDEHGHDVGDVVLRQVAERLTDGRRRVDTVVRLGGDEFVILFTDLEDGRGAARAVAEQCLASIAEPFQVAGKEIRIGVSIGIAVCSDTAMGASHLLTQADAAMYQAKRLGKGRLAFLDEAPPLA